jgi:signal transduction histidine kinase
MKYKTPRMFKAYQEGLHRYLKDAPDCNLKEANKLGKRALSIGLETLDLAKLHQESLISLVFKTSPVEVFEDMIRLAGNFFAEAVTPIEGNHRAAKEANIELKSTIDKLSQRTLELAESNSELNEEMNNRKTAERLLETSQLTTSELLAESLLLQEDLRLLSRRLMVAQEDERKRISRELHDIVAQTLTGINVHLATLTLQTDANSENIHQKIVDTQKLVAKSMDIVHRFAGDLRPTVLDDLGLIPALKSYLKDFMERSGIRTSLIAFSGVEKFSSEVRTVLYRVSQEALINVEHHSKATNLEISITKLKDVVRMEICDDGNGFKMEKPVQSRSCQKLGLLGMRERVEMIDGQFFVMSEPGKGTTVRVDVPMAFDCDSSPIDIPLPSDANS